MIPFPEDSLEAEPYYQSGGGEVQIFEPRHA